MKKEPNIKNPYATLSAAPIKAPTVIKSTSVAATVTTGSKDLRVKAGK